MGRRVSKRVGEWVGGQAIRIGFSMGRVQVGPGHTIPITVNTITMRGTVSQSTPQTCSVVKRPQLFSWQILKKKAVTCC